MLNDGKDGMAVFEHFLLEIIKRDPNYDSHQPKELQLKKLIDRFMYILHRQTEIKQESKALEHEVEQKTLFAHREREETINRIIKISSSIHNLTATNETLANELKQIRSNIQ